MALSQPLSGRNTSRSSLSSSHSFMNSANMLDAAAADSVVSTAAATSVHPLQHKWQFWAHLAKKDGSGNEDWSLAGYRTICTFETMEDVVAVMESLPDRFIQNSMLFVMRDGVTPMWEDPAHCAGGCFSFKVACKHVCNVWRHLAYVLTGETVSAQPAFMRSVTGISVSPKRGSSTVKIWMATTAYQNPQLITDCIRNLTLQGCLFSEFGKHTKFQK